MKRELNNNNISKFLFMQWWCFYAKFAKSRIAHLQLANENEPEKFLTKSQIEIVEIELGCTIVL